MDNLLGLTLQNGREVVVNNTPLIYNIPNNTWVQHFEVAPPPPPPTKATSTSTGPASAPSDNVAPPPPSKKSSGLGAAVGGAAGGIVAVAAIGLFFYRWRKRAGNGGDPSQLKRSGDGNTAGFGNKGGVLGRNNRDEDTDDKDPYGEYPGAHAVQLQRSMAQHTGDLYLPSSQFVQVQSSSPPLPPLLQHLPPRPETQNRNTILSYRGNPRDVKSGIDILDNNGASTSGQESLRFSGVSSSPPPFLPFQPRESIMSSSPAVSPQREEGYRGFSPVDPYGHSICHEAGNNILSAGSPQESLGSFPVDPYGQLIYYDTGKNALSANSPQGPLGSFPVESQGRSTYYDRSSSILSGPSKSPDSHLTSTPYSNSPQYNPIGSDRQEVRLDSRSPQEIGPGYEISPAAWMAAASTRDSFGNPQAVFTQGPDGSVEISSRGSYYPPPPGQQQPEKPESDLMQKRLKLLKAQHELDLEKMRLEQESQLQTVQKQLLQSGG